MINRLNELLYNLRDHFYDINFGGCCVIAVMLYRELVDYFPVRFSLYEWGAKNKTDVINRINNTQSGFNHVVCEVKINGRWWTLDVDDDAIYSIDFERQEGRKLIRDAMSFELAEQISNELPRWNRCFNRDQIPAMQRMVTEFFSELEQEQAA